jgi:preprotein translocase subunit SecF
MDEYWQTFINRGRSAIYMGRKERRLQARRLLTDDEQPHRSVSHGPVARFFNTHYHKLQLIPLIILVLCIGYNIYFYADTGDFVRKGVSLAGGTSVTVSTASPIDQRALEEELAAAFPQADLSVRVLRSGTDQTGFTVDAANIDPDAAVAERLLVAKLRETYATESVSVETTGPALGDSFFRQTLLAVLVAFVLMAVVVFIAFRTFIPSAAVVLAGFSTVISTLAVFNLLGFQLSTAGVAAFLMLIGYSIDTDILLSTRVLKGNAQFIDAVWSAAKTGLTMQITTAITVSVVLFFSNNQVFSQIMTIILIGMFFDVLYTWIQNAAILQWYVGRKQ